MAHTSGNRHVQQGITFIYLQKPELHQTAEKPKEQKLLRCSSEFDSSPSVAGQAARPAPHGEGRKVGFGKRNLRNKIIVRTELPGNSQREAPTAAGQGQPRPCSSQSQVHCSASLKFQLFHYFHLYLTPRGAEPRSDPPGKAQAPARALGASSDSPTTFGRGVVTGAGTVRDIPTDREPGL